MFNLIFHFFFTLVAFISLSTAAHGENAKYIILMIADGWGVKHIEAVNSYRNTTGNPLPFYQTDPSWTKYLMSTFPHNGDYDPVQAASNFNYLLSGFVTDSAAAATALYTGIKTENSRITVSHDGADRLFAIVEEARAFGKTVGAVSSVPVSHATPGAWFAHNDDRGNFFALADEGFFGDPNTTGPPSGTGYAGGHGSTDPPADVIIGDGRSSYVNSQIRNKLSAESGIPGKHYLVERENGIDGGNALLAAAQTPGIKKLAGLFDLIYRNADGLGGTSAERLENPTLAESTTSALTVLDKDPNGFVLMVEGGAVDWASHANNLDQMIGEMKDFDDAVQAVIDWVDDTGNDSGWGNTLLIVTGDHECGYLTRNFGILPDIPLGQVSPATLAKEKIVDNTGGRRASWDDNNGNGRINSGETVYWAWNSGNHTNSVIPLYARGFGSELFAGYIAGYDLLFEGDYINNSDVFNVMYTAMASCTETGTLSISPDQTLSGNPINLTSIVTESNAANVTYTVSEGISCPAQNNDPVITRQDTWKYDTENSEITWMNTGYNDSSWSTGNGVFGTESSASEHGYSIMTPVPSTNTSMFFRKTFGVCNPSAITELTLNALFDDALAVYINGIQVYIENVTGDPPPFDGGVDSWDEATNYQAIDLSSVIGLSSLRDLLVPGSNNVIAIGIYNALPTSSDIVWDGELTINHNQTSGILFTGNNMQAQSINTSGWSDSVKTLNVTGDDALCLTPLPPANDTFTYDSNSQCTQTGSLFIMQGQTLNGNPVDLTSIVTENNAANVTYTVSEGVSCPAQDNSLIITRNDIWKYDIENSGTSWMNKGYNDSGWSTGSGVFGTETSAAEYGYSITTPISSTNASMFFRKTFNVCDPSEITSLTLNSLFDDGVAVYINGIQVFSENVSGNPPAYNGGVSAQHEARGYESKDLSSVIGLTALRNLLVPGSNMIAIGIYNNLPSSSDIVWDSELTINHNETSGILFTGDNLQAQSVNTSGWSEGEKGLVIRGDDTTCLTPLSPVDGTFTFGSPQGDVQPPISIITAPATGTALNSSSPDPFTVSGSATDNISVSQLQISVNGGPWQPATCTGCPGTDVAWTYNWQLPSDGNYTIQSRATDSAGNIETPAPGNTVLVNRTAPVDWSSCRTEGGRTTLAAGSVVRNLSLTTPLANTAKAFILVDSSGNSQVRQGRHHMVSADITDTGSATFRRAGSTGQAEISYALVECFNNEFIVQRGELVLPSGATSGTAAISSVNMNNAIVLVNARSNITANAQYQAHVTGELLDSATVQIRRASEATGADTSIIYQVVEFSAASGVKVQTGEVVFNGGQATTDNLSSAVDLDSSWLYYSYDAGNNGLNQTAISGQLTSANQVTFERHSSASYKNRIRYFVVEFPPGDVTVQRGSSSFTGRGAATQSHSIAVSPVSEVNKTWTYVTNTTSGTGTAFPRNRWTETLSSPSTIKMTNWRANNTAASANFQWQVMEFTGSGR